MARPRRAPGRRELTAVAWILGLDGPDLTLHFGDQLTAGFDRFDDWGRTRYSYRDGALRLGHFDEADASSAGSPLRSLEAMKVDVVEYTDAYSSSIVLVPPSGGAIRLFPGPAVDTATSSEPEDAAACRDHHVVRVGDPASSIAERYGLDLSALLELNPGIDVDMRVGSTVALPCDAVPVRASADRAGLERFASRPVAPAGFVRTNSLTIASDRQVYIVTGGVRAGRGQIRIETFDRAGGRPTGDTVADIASCGGAVEVTSDISPPLDAVRVTCTTDDTVATLDVFTARTTSFVRPPAPTTD